MPSTIIELLSSKKFITALIAIIAAIAARYGLQLDANAILEVVAPLWAFVIAQGVADHGKSAAQVAAAAQATPPAPKEAA